VQLKTKKITKIRAGFIQDSFSLWFPAIIVCTTLIKSAIQAAMQVGAAVRTLLLPADKAFGVNLFPTLMANFHNSNNIDVINNSQEK
jgi:hypothetical protein